MQLSDLFQYVLFLEIFGMSSAEFATFCTSIAALVGAGVTLISTPRNTAFNDMRAQVNAQQKTIEDQQHLIKQLQDALKHERKENQELRERIEDLEKDRGGK